MLSALPVFELCSDSRFCAVLVVIGIPGMLLSAAVSGNIHVFNPWLVLLFSWLLYALLLLALEKLIRSFCERL